MMMERELPEGSSKWTIVDTHPVYSYIAARKQKEFPNCKTVKKRGAHPLCAC